MNNAEFDVKQQRITALLEKHHLDALLLRRTSSFAWATGGVDAHINTADSEGIAALLIGNGAKAVLTNNIEAERLAEESDLLAQGWEIWESPWYEDSWQGLNERTRGWKLGTDLDYPGAVDLGAELAWLRSLLTPEEVERFRLLARDCAEGMGAAVGRIQPGMNEFQISALLSEEVESRGVQAVVNLIATDERIYKYRHPLPTGKQLERYAMLILCGRRQGLICSLSRLVYFGRLAKELRKKSADIARVDAEMIAATRTDAPMSGVLERGIVCYAEAGYPDEWRRHHQGGVVGYQPREITAVPNSPYIVREGQIYAWNPTISGVKSEDSVLVTADGPEVLTSMADWPTLDIETEQGCLCRPMILEMV